MKKVIVILMLFVASVATALAQNYAEIYVRDIHDYYINFCGSEYDGVIIYGEAECNYKEWWVNGNYYYTDSIVLDSTNVDLYSGVYIQYDGCEVDIDFIVTFYDPHIDNPFGEPIIWKRQGETITLHADGYSVTWSNGSIDHDIEVTEPGTYSVNIYDGICGSETFSVEIRDNVELYRATCNLRTNLNQVTWLTTPEQAEYISAVKVYRNTYQLVATVPYTDGSFTDDIGSEATQWQYHLVGVDSDGNDCPIPSYWKRTIHLDHVQGTQGQEILQWTPYQDEQESNSVIAYNIYDVVGGEPRLVMQVGNFTNVYTFNPDDFNGYGTVAAVFASKDTEDMAFSNLTADILAVGEQTDQYLKIYPNPATDHVTIEGTGTLTITNTLGQNILTREIDGKTTIELPQGMYFVKLGETTRKIVVE